jgi:hypothetical protein
MAETQQNRGRTSAARQHDGLRDYRRRESTGWVGWIFFASIMMIMVGVFQTINGLVAIFKDEVYAVTSDGLIVSADYTAWGWVHLILGLIAAGAGYAILRARLWARIVGIVLAVVSAVINLAFLPAYPLWGAIIITVNVIVIYALAVHGSEIESYDV